MRHLATVAFRRGVHFGATIAALMFGLFLLVAFVVAGDPFMVVVQMGFNVFNVFAARRLWNDHQDGLKKLPD